MLDLQRKGAHNLNLVTPTIWSSHLKKAIRLAKEQGLIIPLIWNSNGYETVEVLQELVGLIDIYLPDYKYDFEKLAKKYSFAPSYPLIAKKAILEMFRQVGDLVFDKNGLAQKGLLIRHLVLPNQMENTKNCLKFIRSVSEGIYLSLMSQYNPLYKACEYGEIHRPISQEEYLAAQKLVAGFDIKNGWVQDFGGSVKRFTPDFGKENPFA
jgi:putative pyruvate formate lyase activating enzyme